jgi:hypothetical protein
MKGSSAPVEISKIIFICAVSVITCLLTIGLSYLAPQNPILAENSAVSKSALEDSVQARNASPGAHQGMRGKMKATAPWDRNPNSSIEAMAASSGPAASR